VDLAHIRSTIQPGLDQDFDALFEEFVEDTGTESPEAFLRHLLDFGLVDKALAEPLLSAPAAEPSAEGTGIEPIQWDEEGPEEEATVLARTEDLINLSEVAATSQPALPVFDPDAQPAPTLLPDPADATAPQPDTAAPRPDTAAPQPDTAPATATDTPDPPVPEELPEPPPYEDAPTGLGAPQRLSPITNTDFRADAEDNYTDRKRTQFRRNNGELHETGAFQRPAKRQRRRRPQKKRDDTRYRFVGNVGEGAMGTVHLVQDQQLHRTIAYKEMSEDIAQQPALASKFLAEAQITAQLEHPNIVPVYALEGQAAYTMKLIRGRTVEDLINETRKLLKKGRPLDEDHALEARLDLFLKVCDAMAFSHARGVVHRDLKPENIMLGEFGEVYVMDWGIAHLLTGDFTDHPHVEGLLDEGDLIIGTAGYMSPEQADGKTAELTGASDQYALGLILHELIGLKPAVTGKNPLHIMTRQQLGEVNKLVHMARRPIAPELVAIVDKATRFEPSQRYESVDAMADDLRRFLRGEAVRAKPDNPWQALVRFTGRHRQATLLAGMFVIFASLFLVLLLGVYTQISASRAAAREQALSNLVTSAGRHASVVEGQFLRFEGLLLILATTSEDMLTLGESSPRDVYLASSFDDPTASPPGLVDSSQYGTSISLDASVFTVPAGTDPEDARSRLRRLEPMNRHYRKVMLRSQSEEAASYTPRRAVRALADVGVPVRWTYVATAEGAYNVFPGHSGYPAGFDPRDTTWYQRAADAKGPVWTSPMPDEDLPGGELVVPCTMPLRDFNGKLLGVAGLDVRFDYLANELLAPQRFAGTAARILITDQSGEILIDPDNQTPMRSMLPFPQVVDAMTKRRSGSVEIGDQTVVYTRMASLDWYHIMVGPTAELLSLVR
jgi:serine/threonine-protein kinase